MTTRLQLHLSAKNLKNLKGFMGTSDPFAVVTVRGDNENNSPHIVGQTEVYVLKTLSCSRAFSFACFGRHSPACLLA